MLSRTVIAMVHLPQELDDAIIDQFAPRGEAGKPDGYFVPESEGSALMACALVSRGFLSRSREHLFAGVQYFTNGSSRLEMLVSESPHILALYVK
jgi:hypothetical protein